MRILFLNDRLSERGGADLWLRGIIETLGPAHDPQLAVGRIDGSADPPCPTHVRSGLASRVREPSDIDELWRELAPDVVHVHNVVNPEVLEWASRRDAVITVHDHRCFCPGQGKLTLAGEHCTKAMGRETCAGCFEHDGYFDEILALTNERLAAVACMRVIAPSHYIARELDQLGVSGTAVIPPFVHGLDPTAEPSGEPCVLFVGRLARAKGVFDAAEAWRRSGLGEPLVFAGTGPERGALERAEHPVLGWIPHASMSALYRRATVVVMPSRWQEPFGMVGPEALTMGVPVAAWRSGGIEEWHTGPGLCEWGDVDGLADAIARLAGTRAPPAPVLDRDQLVAQLVARYA